jgi:hypothetical protein
MCDGSSLVGGVAAGVRPVAHAKHAVGMGTVVSNHGGDSSTAREYDAIDALTVSLY